jgi:membrane associated rhomboid family serine protease
VCSSDLIVLCVGFFLVQLATPVEITANKDGQLFQVQSDQMTELLALVSFKVRAGEWYRLLGHMFLHGGFWHLAFNMWGLYLFGSLLEKRIGSYQFVLLYLISGLAGAGFWLLANWNSDIPCIGASGALFGVLVGAALFFPDLQLMLLFPPIPMKLRTFAIVYALLEIFLEFSGGAGGIAHIVHLGGFVGGYVFLRVTHGADLAWDPLAFLGGRRRGLYDVGGTVFSPPEVSQDELDRLLDKISSQGINALSEEEMATLRRAREAMRRQG